ncbi:zinc ribbon domain-containing protein [Pseudobacteroides cellulosolvens]|nr:zinc ribbon domain-containing protein [Pseudobacteroides cellulosolvens]
MSNSNGNSIFKIIAAILLVAIGFWLISNLLIGTGLGINIGFRSGYGGDHMYMGSGAGYGSMGIISFVLFLLIKILFVLFIVGLIIGIVVAVKKYVFTDDDIRKIKGTFSGKKADAVKKICTDCGKELNDEWKVCPVCGNAKETLNS